ncbi:MAG: nitronate monooxygenase family protein [Gammaproteobacteria bacterium]|nr:nitronate monooxygenase family protein [Gammaproteobacteria bacterium]
MKSLNLVSRLPRLMLRGRSVLPILQGGMGVGISANRLASAVAREGAVGTIASVDLRHLHPDIMSRLKRCRDTLHLLTGNLEALDREVRAARAAAGPEGFIAVNVMRALNHYGEFVRQACASGANAIVMGAGLPLDLPELTQGQDVALIPILSEERGIEVLLRKWMRKGRLPDAIIIEHPGEAGGHLGATRLTDVTDTRFDFRRVLKEAAAVIKRLGLSGERIPLIPAGGIGSFARIQELLEWGASAVQLGTAFAVTEECDAHPNFKTVLAQARTEDIVTFMSTAGLPARAVLTPWLKRYLARETLLKSRACEDRHGCASHLECLSHCGFKDGNPDAGQFCIETQLAAAVRGNVTQGLFFRGTTVLPFGTEIRPVRDLLHYLLTGLKPVAPAMLA